MNQLAQELRDVAEQIEGVARSSPCWSRAQQIIVNCTNHLRAEARVIDLQRDDHDRYHP